MDNKINVWLVNEGENLPGDDNNPRLQRMGLLAYELEKLGVNIVWWQSTFNHYQKKFRYYKDTDIELTNHLQMKLLHSCGYSKNVCVKRMIHEWKTARKFYKKSKDMTPPDVIVSAMPTIAQAFFVTKYAKKHNIPSIVDLRDLNPDVFVSPFKGIVKKLVSMAIFPLKIMLSISLKRAHALVGTTEPYLNWGLKYAKRQRLSTDKVFYVSYPYSTIITNIDDSSRWRKYKDYKGIICCFFGQFGQLVDFDTVIETAKLCRDNNLDVLFLLCGKGELLNKYQSLVELKKLDNVILPGWVNKTDIMDIGFISDCALMAYKKNDNFEMQMPNKFSESLSLGLAILLQPSGVMKNVIEQNKCGLHYENANELFDSLKYLSQNRDILEKMKINSRDVFEKDFMVENVYKEYGKYIITIAEDYKKCK